MPQKLDASTGASGPHDFAVRDEPRSSVAAFASTASHRAFVTIATRPSHRVRRAGLNPDLPRRVKRFIFARRAGQTFGDLPVELFCRALQLQMALAFQAKQPAVAAARVGRRLIAAGGLAQARSNQAMLLVEAEGLGGDAQPVRRFGWTEKPDGKPHEFTSSFAARQTLSRLPQGAGQQVLCIFYVLTEDVRLPRAVRTSRGRRAFGIIRTPQAKTSPYFFTSGQSLTSSGLAASSGEMVAISL